MIIDITYFVGKVNIAQLAQPEVIENVELLISQFEREYLIKTVGLEMTLAIYENVALIDTVVTPPALPPVIDQKWLDLINGSTFEYCGELTEWKGYRNTIRQSVLANYVWIEVIGDKADYDSGVGRVRPKTENATVVSPKRSQVEVWNQMVEWTHAMLGFIADGDYPEYVAQKPFCKVNNYGI